MIRSAPSVSEAPTPLKGAFDEEEIKILLLGDEGEITRAVELLHAAKREHIWRMIRSACPGLRPHSNGDPNLDALSIEDVYHDTLIDLINEARAKRYDPSRDLMAYICTIATNRVRDAMRRHRTKIKTKDAVISAVADRLESTEWGAKWKRMSPEDKDRFAGIVRAEVQKLPEIQAQTATVWLHFFPGVPPWPRMVSAMRAIYGGNPTVTSASSAWTEAKSKLRAALARAGF